MKREEVARRFLAEIYAGYSARQIEGDPVLFPHRFQNPKDREVVALLAALLAFGNAKSILASTEKILAFLGPEPYQAILNFKPSRPFPPLGHRWVRHQDLVNLFTVLQQAYHSYGSLEDLFLGGCREKDPHYGPALDHFSAGLKRLKYFFPSPRDGSACKRLNMFLRWMVRPADGVDLGLWKLPPSKLIIPLDTHVFQFARRFRLTSGKTPNWKAAVEVTEFLKTLDPSDPVKYDFAICHYGMEEGYVHRTNNTRQGQRDPRQKPGGALR